MKRKTKTAIVGRRKNRRPDARAMQSLFGKMWEALFVAGQELENLKNLASEVDWLRLKLAWVDKNFEDNVRACPEEEGMWELGGGILATGFLVQFLRAH